MFSDVFERFSDVFRTFPTTQILKIFAAAAAAGAPSRAAPPKPSGAAEAERRRAPAAAAAAKILEKRTTNQTNDEPDERRFREGNLLRNAVTKLRENVENFTKISKKKLRINSRTIFHCFNLVSLR